MNAKTEILKLAREQVDFMNSLYATQDLPGFERIRERLTGMLICLNRIALPDEEAYCVNYFDDGCELGYYERGHHWKHLAGVEEKVNA